MWKNPEDKKTEDGLQEESKSYETGNVQFSDMIMGKTKKLKRAFVKVLADPDSGKILGCHIIGEDASVLIHEVNVVVRNDLKVSDIADLHPTLSKIIKREFKDVSGKTN